MQKRFPMYASNSKFKLEHWSRHSPTRLVCRFLNTIKNGKLYFDSKPNRTLSCVEQMNPNLSNNLVETEKKRWVMVTFPASYRLPYPSLLVPSPCPSLYPFLHLYLHLRLSPCFHPSTRPHRSNKALDVVVATVAHCSKRAVTQISTSLTPFAWPL